MNSAGLRAFLKRYGLSQDQFAKMIGASLRSVSAWLTDGASNVPGPAEAYARLFTQLTEQSRQLEILRARGLEGVMRDGVFLIDYSSAGANGTCTLTLDQGTAYGFDVAGGMYDGHYIFDPESRAAEIELRVTIPPNVPVVWGSPKPYQWSFEVNAKLDPNADAGRVRLVNTMGGPDVDVAYRFIRSLPLRPAPSGAPSLQEALNILKEMRPHAPRPPQ